MRFHVVNIDFADEGGAGKEEARPCGVVVNALICTVLGSPKCSDDGHRCSYHSDCMTKRAEYCTAR